MSDQIGTNVEEELLELNGKKDNLLILKVALDEVHGDSKSGKTSIIGTTHGFKKLGGRPNVSYNLNVVIK
jgi:hypothetical protein